MAKPEKCITVEEARDLQNNWKRTRGKEIERGQGYVDTPEFWYSIAELEEYIEYVKLKSGEQGVNNPGLRIYLGAYPSLGQKKSFTTIFITPTMPMGDEKSLNENEGEQVNNYEIDPINESQQGYPPIDY